MDNVWKREGDAKYGNKWYEKKITTENRDDDDDDDSSKEEDFVF